MLLILICLNHLWLTLFRCKDLDQLQSSGTAALKGVGLQAIVVEFLITNVSEIFDKTRVVHVSDKPIRDCKF